MAQDSTTSPRRASLGAVGKYRTRHCFFVPRREQIPITQQVVTYRPTDKWRAGLVGIRWGAKTIAHSHGTGRVDPAGQPACGRQGCADPSTMARTLRACPAEHVAPGDRISWDDRQR